MALDFSRLNTLDSAGIGMLLKIHRQMIDYRGDLFIFGCQLSVRKVLHTLKLDDLIPIHDTFKAGVSHVTGNP
jgi:anti-anti-sigma factor